MRLNILLLMCFVLSGSADAGKLSQVTKRFVERMNAAAQKAATPVKQGVVTLVCGAMLCAFGLQDADGLGKIAFTGASGGSVSSAGLEMELIGGYGENHRGQRLFYEPSWMEGFSSTYLDAKVVYDGDGLHSPRLRVRGKYDWGFPGNLTYASGKGLRAERALLGFDWHDFRTHGFDNEATGGFTALYPHLVSPGFIGYLWKRGFPVINTSIGLGDLGFMKVGYFEQEDLRKWAGFAPGFSTVFWLNTSLNWRFLSFWEGVENSPFSQKPRPPLDFGIKVEQLRSVFGDIDTQTYTNTYIDIDGDFTAIWEAVTADIVWTFAQDPIRPPYKESSIAFAIEGSVYRQRLNAKLDNGKTFSQNEMGKRIETKVLLLVE